MSGATNQADDFPPEILAAYARLKGETLAALELQPLDMPLLCHHLHRLCGAAGMFNQAELGLAAGQLERQLTTLAPTSLNAQCHHLAALIRAR
ncbi:MAG: hypothetical protein RLY97_215 [Pseudomonadota bacterium]|jgi:hypothetical protein